MGRCRGWARALFTAAAAAAAAGQSTMFAVDFSGSSESDVTACSASEAGSAAVVTPLGDTGGECAPLHSAPSETPYFSLETNGRGALVRVRYLCKNRNCSSCLVTSTSLNVCHEVPSGGGGAAARSVSFRGGAAPSLLPATSANAPEGSVSVLWYTSCGDASALREIDAVGALGGNASVCRPVASPGGGTPLYHSLHVAGGDGGAVSGGWMCSSDDCDPVTCTTNFRRLLLGTSQEAGLSGCFRVEQTAGLDVTSGGGVQQPCSCALNHVFLSFYSSDAGGNAACGLATEADEVVISRLDVGSSLYAPPRAPADEIYRFLEMDWDEPTQSNYISKLGIDCEPDSDRCTYLLPSVGFLQCYRAASLGGSLIVSAPSDVCYGAPELSLPPRGVATFWFTGEGCPSDLDQEPSTTLTIRGYRVVDGKCRDDGSPAGGLGRYHLSQGTDGKGGVVYSGGLRCDDNCSKCDVPVSGWPEGSCQSTSIGAMQIFPSTELVRCRTNAPAPPSPGPPGAPTPPAANRGGFPHDNPAVVIGASAGALVVAVGVVALVVVARRRRAVEREYEALGGSARSVGRAATREEEHRPLSPGRSVAQAREAAEFYNGV